MSSAPARRCGAPVVDLGGFRCFRWFPFVFFEGNQQLDMFCFFGWCGVAKNWEKRGGLDLLVCLLIQVIICNKHVYMYIYINVYILLYRYIYR